MPAAELPHSYLCPVLPSLQHHNALPAIMPAVELPHSYLCPVLPSLQDHNASGVGMTQVIELLHS